MKYFVFIFLLLLSISCHEKSDRNSHRDPNFVENGVAKQFDEQNRLSAEISYKEGVRNGVSRYYYASGALSDEIMYVDDMKNGMAKKYHKNGNIYSLTPYINDEKDGMQRKYYSNGKLWAETPYLKGEAGIGLKEYKRDGSLRENYPKIEVEKLIKTDHVVLTFFLSNYSKRVVFYVSDLMQNKYIPPMAKPLYAREGSVKYEIPIPKNQELDTTINIVAKYQTNDYNIYVTEKKYQLTLK